jgi:hypothetical protein
VSRAARRLVLASGLIVALAFALMVFGALARAEQPRALVQGGSYAASWGKPGACEVDHASQHLQLSLSVAHGGHIRTSKLAAGSPSDLSVATALILSHSGALPPARNCGARAMDNTIMAARAAAGGGPVVRLTGGFDSGPPARPALEAKAFGTCTVPNASRGDDGGKTPRSCATGIQHSENAGTVTRPKLPIDPRRDFASSVRTGASRWRDFAGGRETSCTLDAARAAIRKAGRSPKSDDGATRRAVWLSLVGCRGSATDAEVAGSNPVTAPHPKTSKRVVRAQQQGSASRIASEDDSASGSAAARPAPIGGGA